MIHRHRGNRRKINVTKALRKERLAREIYGGTSKPLHRLSKGKIHCSCPMCSSKTNSKRNKSRGPVDANRHFCRLAMTNQRYGRRDYKISDRRKVDSMNFQISDFIEDI